MNYANQIGYSDIYPFEITRKVSMTTFEVREMDAERDPTWHPEFVVGGFAGHCTNQHSQRWNITSNAANRTVRIRLGKRGWKDKHGHQYQISESPTNFHDYNF